MINGPTGKRFQESLPRDLYDLWFISHKLGREFKPDAADFEPSLLKRDLRKYLPRSHWRLVDTWIG